MLDFLPSQPPFHAADPNAIKAKSLGCMGRICLSGVETQVSEIYKVISIQTIRYQCKKCGVYSSEDDFINDEPCRTCSGTRYFKGNKVVETPLECIATDPTGRFRHYPSWTPSQIDAKRKKGFTVVLKQTQL